METLFFCFFTFCLLFCALNVIFNLDSVNSVLFLVLVFCNASALFVLLEVEFISLLLIVVYVGAIAVLFLFVIIILNVKSNSSLEFKRSNFNEQLQSIPFFILLLVVLSLGSFFLIKVEIFLPNEFGIINYTNWVSFIDSNSLTNITLIGQTLYTYYIHYFLVCGLILLVSLVSTISLTIQLKNVIRKENYQYVQNQKQYQQISRKSRMSVFLIKLKSKMILC